MTTTDEKKDDEKEEKEAEEKKEEKGKEELKEEKEEEKEEAKVGDNNNDEEAVKAVAERLKFFFSDANVRQDRFMRNLLMHNDNSDQGGCVPVEVLLRFNTIKKYTTDADVVVKAAKSLSGFLTVKDDNKGIARVDPFTKEKMDGNIPVTLYVSNLPTTTHGEGNQQQTRYAVRMEQVRDLFTSYGDVAFVKLRYKYNGDEEPAPGKKHARRSIPAGAALVEFETEESMQKAAEDVVTSKEGVEVEPKRKLTIGESTLTVVTLKDFIAEKKKQKGEGSDRKDGEEAKESKKREREDESNDAKEEFKVEWKPHCVIELKGLSASCDREAILKAISEGLDLKVKEVKENKIFADFSRGQTDGAIRFAEPSDAVDSLVAKLSSGDVTIDGAKVESVRVLEGEDEIQYWKKYAEFRKKLQRHNADERSSKRRKNWKKR